MVQKCLGAWALGVASGLFEEMMVATVSAISMWLTTMIFMVGFPLFLGWLARGFWKALRPTAAQCEPEPEDEIVEPNTFDKSTQVNMGRTPEERRWEEEYVERCNFLRGALHEEHQTVLACERELRNLRDQVARLEAERHDPRVLERAPSAVAIATSRGRCYHRPGCQSLRNSGGVREYAPCQYCFRDVLGVG